MKKSIQYVYIIIAIILLVLNLLVLNLKSSISVMCIFLALLIITKHVFSYQKDNLWGKKSVMITMGLFALIQAILYYLTGFYDGFSSNAIKLNFENIFLIIMPTLISIYSIEFIRYIASQKFKKVKYTEILITIMFVLMDITLFHPSPNFRDLENLLEFIGITLFPSIVNNCVFNKLTIQYGYKPILVYRFINILSYYMFPVIPNTYVLFRAIARIILPLIMYLLISYMYDRIEFEEVFVRKKKPNIISIIIILLAVIFAGLVSCKFKYGVLTVGSPSMSGTIEVGDVVFFERYDNEDISIGDIIIFKMGKRNIIHRVEEIGVFNDDYVYITKGDRNQYEDPGLRYKSDILGIVHKKIKYLGYPSIWIRNLFKE